MKAVKFLFGLITFVVFIGFGALILGPIGAGAGLFFWLVAYGSIKATQDVSDAGEYARKKKQEEQ